ncbi:hypothetical protein L345_15898 [Ophiophagus hannah]|uniref:Uncharacterized protein n=1 Tax=Ophiophagus hannah TaxID=8665 RepID=V8N8E0_OPHHA|nr:hypothetical protein L345_15898 [Ophiophagus hannah]
MFYSAKARHMLPVKKSCNRDKNYIERCGPNSQSSLSHPQTFFGIIWESRRQ